MELFLYKICTILVQNARRDAARRAVRLRSKWEWLKAPLADEGNVTLHGDEVVVLHFAKLARDRER